MRLRSHGLLIKPFYREGLTIDRLHLETSHLCVADLVFQARIPRVLVRYHALAAVTQGVLKLIKHSSVQELSLERAQVDESLELARFRAQLMYLSKAPKCKITV